MQLVIVLFGAKEVSVVSRMTFSAHPTVRGKDMTRILLIIA
jgi:hypothetical protein